MFQLPRKQKRTDLFTVYSLKKCHISSSEDDCSYFLQSLLVAGSACEGRQWTGCSGENDHHLLFDPTPAATAACSVWTVSLRTVTGREKESQKSGFYSLCNSAGKKEGNIRMGTI